MTLYCIDHTVSYWIGLTDVAKLNTWEWVHGRSLPNFTDWHPTQPADNDEHCALLLGITAFKWHDQKCDAIINFICQEDIY